MTVRELLARIDSRELSEWMAYYELNPFGSVRDDLQAGIIASTIANVNRGKNDKSFAPSDFMPYMEKPQQSEGDMQAVMNALAGK
tara:strand:+ start:868 stop:1122 length:255 start_codon:yes stop_codon:yes gene_type:complete